MVQILAHTVGEMNQKWFSQVRNICVCLAHRVWLLSPNLLILLFKTTSSYFKPANCSFIHSLTKSSPESAPIEVMDSLLMVRGIRTLLRGAVAASSAIFFFSLANMVILSTSLSLHAGCEVTCCVEFTGTYGSTSSQRSCVPTVSHSFPSCCI